MPAPNPKSDRGRVNAPRAVTGAEPSGPQPDSTSLKETMEQAARQGDASGAPDANSAMKGRAARGVERENDAGG
ncbi:MAG: hypothetical protein EOP82_09525 [Variovorax sp.]|nr:MAG: hypothetical protein EOP82_09525 [Variovorax sp.]